MRIHRLFSILDELRSRRRPVAASELAEILGVSARTLYRDFATLRDMGAPIRGEAGVGYQLDGGFFLPPLSLDADERDAVVLALSMLAADAKADASLITASHRILTKLKEVGADLRALDRPLLALGRSTAPDGLEDVRRALHGRLKIEVRYQDEANRASVRRVRPLGITVFDTGWVLTAWCELRGDFRDFRLDRIQSLNLSGERFQQRVGQRYIDYLSKLSLTKPAVIAAD